MNAFPEGADEVLDLLKQHVPELASGIVVVRGMARERGKRTVIAVSSNDPNTGAIKTFTRDQRATRVAEGLSRAGVETVVWEDPTEQVVRLCPTSELRIRRQISKPPEAEHLSIVEWDDSIERFVTNLLLPMRVLRVSFDERSHRVIGIVTHDSVSAPPDFALHSELLLRLTGWTLDFDYPDER